MYCKKCQSTINITQSEQSTENRCPFCGSLLQECDYDSIAGTLRQIANRLGKDVLLNAEKTLAIFADLEPKLTSERLMLSHLYKCDGHIELYYIDTKPQSEKKDRIKNVVRQMVQKFLVSETTAKEICKSFLDALNLDTSFIDGITALNPSRTKKNGNIQHNPMPQTLGKNIKTGNTNKQRKISHVAIAVIAVILAVAVIMIAKLPHKYTSERSELDISTLNVGDIVKFGNYEQDGNADNGDEKIEWIVLDKADGKVLLLSKDCLEYLPINNYYNSETWVTSTLREWLNDDFYKTAFSDSERSLVRIADLDNCGGFKPNQPNTEDKVFLLSFDEAKQYFDSDTARTAHSSEAAKKNAPESNAFGETCNWWLRTSGDYCNQIMYVDNNGAINQGGAPLDSDGGENYYGAFMITEFIGVRPAIWIGESFDKTSNGTENANSNEKLSKGSVLSLGEYEQDGNIQNGAEPIDWVVLDVKDGKALVMSALCLEYLPYNNGTSVWEDTTIRSWLNDDFYSSAFSKEEKKRIIESELDNGYYSTNDKVFLLSLDELNSYYPTDSLKVCYATQYAIDKTVQEEYPLCVDGAMFWALRTISTEYSDYPGYHIPFVDFRGAGMGSADGYETGLNYGIRPAMWIEID